MKLIQQYTRLELVKSNICSHKDQRFNTNLNTAFRDLYQEGNVNITNRRSKITFHCSNLNTLREYFNFQLINKSITIYVSK